MYGTIAHFRLKPGTREEFIRTMDSFGDTSIPGWRVDYHFQMDKDPDEFCCLFVVDQQFTNFVFIPFPED